MMIKEYLSERKLIGILECINEEFEKNRISEINIDEFIHDLHEFISDVFINYENVEVKTMYKKIRNYLSSKYIFQDGKYNEEIKEISLKLADEAIMVRKD